MSSEKIDTDQVVSYLNHAFDKAQQKAASQIGESVSKAAANPKPNGKIPNGSTLYNYQVNYCYMIDEIQRGPQYIVPKIISDANELIEQLANEGIDQENK